MKKDRAGKRFVAFIIAAAAIFGLTTLFAFAGLLQFNTPPRALYPVRGVDISSYQGDIDWDVLSRQGISFAFIKATEGSSFVDEFFDANFQGALETDLRVGAYHFFSFDSPGMTQADNYIANVPKAADALPPVVDLEFYADKWQNPPDPDGTRKELDALLGRLEAHYGVKPIIYATEKSYNLYLAGHYEAYDIWIRSILTAPKPLKNQAWTFWQYTNKGRLDGYEGTEYYIDMNVFNGTFDEFYNYARQA